MKNEFSIENKFMIPIECDDCHKAMGYGWDAEYGHPQSVFRCQVCYEQPREGLRMNFNKWWLSDGKYIDPDTEDVPWYDKRQALAELAFDAGVCSMDSLINKLRDERNALATQLAEKSR